MNEGRAGGGLYNSPQLQLLQVIDELRWDGMWCGMVWYGMGCGVVWCGVVWYGVVWCGMVWYGVVWCGVMVWYGMCKCAKT